MGTIKPFDTWTQIQTLGYDPAAPRHDDKTNTVTIGLGDRYLKIGSIFIADSESQKISRWRRFWLKHLLGIAVVTNEERVSFLNGEKNK